jgi:hypothetical protein
MQRMKSFAALFLLFFLVVNRPAAQRFLQYDPPMAGPRKTLRYTPGSEITLRLKDDDGGFYTGYISDIRDSVFYINTVPVVTGDVEAIRIRRSKGRAIIPRAIGWGAHAYLAVRLINSLINHSDPLITPIEIGITAPIIAGYYIYEFGINTRKRTYKPNARHPLRIIILKPDQP